MDKEAPLSRLTLFSPCKVITYYALILCIFGLFENSCLTLIAYVEQINVFLRITNKREDGYHDLASLFHVRSLKVTCFTAFSTFLVAMKIVMMINYVFIVN